MANNGEFQIFVKISEVVSETPLVFHNATMGKFATVEI